LPLDNEQVYLDDYDMQVRHWYNSRM
jgi:hypothetical protein